MRVRQARKTLCAAPKRLERRAQSISGRISRVKPPLQLSRYQRLNSQKSSTKMQKSNLGGMAALVKYSLPRHMSLTASAVDSDVGGS